MFYSNVITVAANTAKASASETIIKMSQGVITDVSFRPRPGHVGLLHAQVFYQEHMIIPSEDDEDLHGDTFPIEWTDWIELKTKPYELKVKAWNDDDTYAHTFDISFTLLPQWVALPYAFAKAITDLFKLLSPRRIFTGSK